MATGNIVSVTDDGTTCYAAIAVNDGGRRGTVEYNVSTPLKREDGADKTVAELRADLAAECKALRDSQMTGRSNRGGVSGTVNV